MKGDWFNAFKAAHNLEFTEEDYEGWKGMVEKDLAFYIKHLPEGSRILECCCGLGCTAIPLSHHYTVVGFDKDDRILEYTRKNASRFGGEIEIINADFRRIDEIFGSDSFDACTSGGVLEHYTPNEVRDLVDRQLIVAPLVFISVPLGDGKKTTDEFEITRYNYTKEQWLKDILKDYNIVDHIVSRAHPKVSGGLEVEELLFMVNRR
ncbi:class I SAM-dependent methyltransferase [Candidatus Altiarchaeota archaeon]